MKKIPDFNDHRKAGGTIPDLLAVSVAVESSLAAATERRLDRAASPEDPEIDEDRLEDGDIEARFDLEPDDSRTWDATDAGNAERFAYQHCLRFRYVEDRGVWRDFDGVRWREEVGGLRNRMAIATARSIRIEALRLSDEPTYGSDGKKRCSPQERMMAWAYLSENRPRQEAMLAMGGHIEPISCRAESFDRDPYQLCTPGGVVSLGDNLRVDPCRPEQFMTKSTRGRLLGSGYRRDAAPNWDAFLQQTFSGDADLTAWVQRAVGLTLIGAQPEHLFLFCFGDGRNGKSTFLNAVKYAMGDYATMLPPNLLVEKRFDQHPTELTELEGVRMAIGAEVPRKATWDEARIKSLSGGDPIKARKTGKDFYEFPASHTLWMSGNEKPRIKGTDEGIWRRLRLIPFTVTVPAASVKRGLPALLEAEANGVLTWAIEGCSAYMAGGLGTCSAVETATGEYREDEDDFGRFIREACIVKPAAHVTKSAMRKALDAWYLSQGRHAPADPVVKSELAKRGIVGKQGSDANDRKRCWLGIGLAENIDRDEV